MIDWVRVSRLRKICRCRWGTFCHLASCFHPCKERTAHRSAQTLCAWEALLRHSPAPADLFAAMAYSSCQVAALPLQALPALEAGWSCPIAPARIRSTAQHTSQARHLTCCQSAVTCSQIHPAIPSWSEQACATINARAVQDAFGSF